MIRITIGSRPHYESAREKSTISSFLCLPKKLRCSVIVMVEWRLGHDDEQDSRQTFELKGERQHKTKSEDCVVRIDDVGNNIYIRLFHICHF